jgi:hypothetical protein
MKSQTILQSATDIAKNPLDKSEMRCTRSMHVKTDLLHSIGNVRSGKGEILKCTSQAAILRTIWKQQVTITCGELSLSVDRGRGRVTLSHTSTLQNISGVLLLGQEQPRGGARDSNPKKVVKVSKIRHSKLTVEHV